MIKGIVINRSQLSKRPVGRAIENISDIKDDRFKNIVISYINNKSVLIKTNLTQEQFNLFTEGKLSRKELEKYI